MKKRLVKYMMMTMIVFTLAGTRAYAAEPSTGAQQQAEEDEDDDDDDGDGDVEDDPVEPNEGSASIIEHGYGPAPVAGVSARDSQGLSNKLDKFYDTSKKETLADLTFDNDLPVISMEETFAEADGYEVNNNELHVPTGTPKATAAATSAAKPTAAPTADVSESLKSYKIKPNAEPKDVKFYIDGEEVNIEEGDKPIFDNINKANSPVRKEENEDDDGNTTVVYIRTTENESHNAIEKAVTKALSEIDNNSRFVTIRVTEGDYDGDLNITSDMLSNTLSDAQKEEIKNNFTLYILSEGSYEPLTEEEVAAGRKFIREDSINADSDSVATLNGNINIEGINVVLAGIYMSLENTIKVKNAAFTYYGSSDGDNVNIERACDEESGGKYKTYGFGIYTGDGDDNVVYSEATHVDDLDIYTGDGNDGITIECSAESAPDRSKLPGKSDVTKTSIETGDGEDTVAVSIGIAQVLSEDRIIDILTGDGYDTLVLTGTLDGENSDNHVDLDQIEENQVLTKQYKITVVESEKNKLRIDTTAENLTDELLGKPEEKIKKENIRGGAYLADKSFTDYVIDPKLFDENNGAYRTLRFTGEPYFAKVIVRGEDFNIYNLDAGKLDIEITGRKINIGNDDEKDTRNYTLKGKNIVIKAEDSDKSVVADKINEFANNIPGLELEIDFGSFNFVTNAFIHVFKRASIISSGSVNMTASSSQTSTLKISVGDKGLQMPVAVKVGNAEIIIEGTVKADGKVSASSESIVDIGADSSGLAKFFVPLAVVVAVTSAETTLKSTGKIESGATTSLKSNTEVTTTCLATVGKLPISLAVSVASVDSHVNVEGTIVSQSDIELIASGKSDVTTESKEKAPQTTKTTINLNDGTKPSGESYQGTNGGNTYGGFFAVAVVLQDVDSSVTGDAKIDAGGDVTIESSSEEKAATHADSSSAGDDSEDGEAQTPSSIADIISGIFGAITGSDAFNDMFGAGESYGKDKLTGIFKKADNKTQGGQFEIAVDPDPHGTVTAPSKANPGDTVTVRVVPDKGYTLDMISMAYTDDNGKTQNKTIAGRYTKENPAKSSDTTFTMPNSTVKLIFVLRKLEKGEEELKVNTTAIDNNAGIDGNVNAGTNSGAEPFKEPEGGYGKDVKVQAEAAPEGTTFNGKVSLDTPTASKDQKVLVHVTPNKGYTISKVVAKYLENGQEKTVEIAADEAGRYIYTIPNLTKDADKTRRYIRCRIS